MGRSKNYVRDEVIEQAMRAFWLNGYAATSLSDLTAITGLNKKSLYNEFGSKEELFNIALNHYNQKRMPLVALLNRQPPGARNIIDFLTELASSTDTRGCLLVLSINERDLLENAACRQVKQDFQSLKKLFEFNLREEFKGSRKDTAPMALLLCSQIFSIAGMGKLDIKKAQIRKSIELLLSQLFEVR